MADLGLMALSMIVFVCWSGVIGARASVHWALGISHSVRASARLCRLSVHFLVQVSSKRQYSVV